ncbi:hypothetical protein AMATHDRAFT_7674 [Amanita thiersii Skay4041]|uniref:Origin recognition complex subunit 2 n=1 Tax=Amanita thiersii Skay4041 TaxID=703135 RepID=A0A2A9NE68_9AGAR|nr:hypothetical protein AMATHDRAFT_7674 [Amanita thiersii Skay4041]
MLSQTSFDAYFTHAAARAQTSSNVFSVLVPPLSPEEYAEGIQSAQSSTTKLQPIQSSILTNEKTRSNLFARFLIELNEGFNLLLYGLGSKRQVLDRFAREYCAKAGHVIIANTFRPDFSLKELFLAIEGLPGLIDPDSTPSTTVENHAKRIYGAFAKPSQKRHLYLIIHNIDAAPLRSPKAKSCLSHLAMNPRIHIVASIDHINAPLLWSSSECATRKPSSNGIHATETPNEDMVDASAPLNPNPESASRGFAWLWHDLTTLEAYDVELAFADRSSISGAHSGSHHRKGDTLMAGLSSGTAMTETAALHILASVTQKAKKLFSLMGNKQLESIQESGTASAGTVDLQQYAIGYDVLFNAARDNFIATNDTAFRSLLGEFRDHELIVAAQAGAGGSGEILWIPMRKERLDNVLQSVQDD